MNKMLKRALAAIEKLPESEQEAIACHILEDMEAEKGWAERFAKSQDHLAELSRQAAKQIAEGEALPFDPSDRKSR